MRYLVIAFALILNTLLFAQRDKNYVDSLLIEVTSGLKAGGVTTYVVSKRYCDGEVAIFNLGDDKICISDGTYIGVYIFWDENGKNLVKKLDNCGLFRTLELTDGIVLDFMEQNKEDVQSHPIRPYTIESKLGGPSRSTATYPCARELLYESPEMSLEQSFHLFDLTNEALERNLYYEYNNTHKAAELEKLLTKVISELDTQFQRQ